MLQAEVDLEEFAQMVHQQSLDQNFTRYQGLPLVSSDYFFGLSYQKKVDFGEAFVLVSGIPGRVDFNLHEGVRVSLFEGIGLQFYIKYYHALKDLEENRSRIHAICVLPEYDHCLLLGKKYNVDAW